MKNFLTSGLFVCAVATSIVAAFLLIKGDLVEHVSLVYATAIGSFIGGASRQFAFRKKVT
ncbi:hypothetical protein EH196_06900 [Bacillus sp. C1-1]|nr:hypothetical protein EH196_06900 [Bacillus sp. C1-1]